MKNSTSNHYERAFENWLIENHIPYILIDEHKRAVFSACKIKSFDFLLYSTGGQPIIAEVKGRTFKGSSLANLTSLECWVTADDIEGLMNWQEIFGKETTVVFVFVYKIEAIDVDLDGREIFNFDEKSYLFLCVKLDDYRRFMKLRSPKWRTVTLPADKFRQSINELSVFLL
jgi:hypothetical protein